MKTQDFWITLALIVGSSVLLVFILLGASGFYEPLPGVKP